MMNKLSLNSFKAVLLAFLFVTACGEFKQDPLEKYPENVRNGVPESDLQTKPDRSPLCQECYRIDVDLVLSMSEGQETPVEIGARVFADVGSFSLSIENLDTFPGAKFVEVASATPLPNEKKYVFKWTPPAGFTGNNVQAIAPLNIKMTAKGGQVTSRNKEVLVLVNRTAKVPRIISSDFDKHETLEGEPAKLTVVVEDNDSTSAEPPRLQFENPTATNDATPFMTFKSVGQDPSNKRWTIVYDFNTRDNDITDNEKNETATFVVISRYGVRTQTQSRSIWVNNSLKDAVSSLSTNSTYSFLKGVKNAMSFTVADPTQDGEVSAVLKNSVTAIPGIVALNCSKVVSNQKWLANCEFSWDIPATSITNTSYSFDIEVKNAGQSGFTPVNKTARATFKINVVTPPPPPLPSPVPSPVASPTPKPNPAPEDIIPPVEGVN